MQKSVKPILGIFILTLCIGCAHINNMPKEDADFKLPPQEFYQKFHELETYKQDQFLAPMTFPSRQMTEVWGEPEDSAMNWYTLMSLGLWWHRNWYWEKGNYSITAHTARPFTVLYLKSYTIRVTFEEKKKSGSL